eukprot:3880287-Amphidinium_carterae.1
MQQSLPNAMRCPPCIKTALSIEAPRFQGWGQVDTPTAQSCLVCTNGAVVVLVLTGFPIQWPSQGPLGAQVQQVVLLVSTATEALFE